MNTDKYNLYPCLDCGTKAVLETGEWEGETDYKLICPDCKTATNWCVKLDMAADEWNSLNNPVEVFLRQIKCEHQKAVEKHPFFAHVLADKREGFRDRVRLQLKDERKQLRREVAQKKVEATSVMRTEYCEFLEAYHNGDLDHCLQELAQCGAVILRMMQMVLREKQEKETEK